MESRLNVRSASLRAARLPRGLVDQSLTRLSCRELRQAGSITVTPTSVHLEGGAGGPRTVFGLLPAQAAVLWAPPHRLLQWSDKEGLHICRRTQMDYAANLQGDPTRTGAHTARHQVRGGGMSEDYHRQD